MRSISSSHGFRTVTYVFFTQRALRPITSERQRDIAHRTSIKNGVLRPAKQIKCCTNPTSRVRYIPCRFPQSLPSNQPTIYPSSPFIYRYRSHPPPILIPKPFITQPLTTQATTRSAHSHVKTTRPKLPIPLAKTPNERSTLRVPPLNHFSNSQPLHLLSHKKKKKKKKTPIKRSLSTPANIKHQTSCHHYNNQPIRPPGSLGRFPHNIGTYTHSHPRTLNQKSTREWEPRGHAYPCFAHAS